jgi:hypothetical protein
VPFAFTAVANAYENNKGILEEMSSLISIFPIGLFLEIAF